MRASEIAKKYNIDKVDFEDFVYFSGLKQSGLKDLKIKDELVEEYVEKYKEYCEKKKVEQSEKAQRIEREKEKRQQELVEIQKQEELLKQKQREVSKILISSGFTFEGYNITKYSGYISGDDAVQIPRSGLFSHNNHGQLLTDALVKIRRQALQELKEAAYDLCCNAIIGVDFDYITLDPQTANITGGTTYEPYVICVTANGNAVIIEKNES